MVGDQPLSRMLRRMELVAEALRSALVAGFRTWLADRLATLGLASDPGLADVAEEAATALDARLGDLLALPFADQARAPMEVVRDAVRPVVDELQRRGVPPTGGEAAFPWDVFSLVPRGIADLGEEAERTLLAWGAAKASALGGAPVVPPTPRRPVVLLVTGDLADRTRLASIVEGGGLEPVVARNPAAVEDALGTIRPVVAFVDLGHRSADEVIGRLAAAGVRVVAYGPHVDDLALVRARSLGAAEVLPRSRFFRDPGRWLPELA